MKQLTCEMCGSTDLMKQDGVFICQTCGCKYSIEEAKRMMVEGTVDVKGTVKVDNSAFVEKSLLNARRALEKEDWEEVEKYYNLVEQNVPKNIEAVFFSAYGKAMLSMTNDDYHKRNQIFNVLNKSISVINDYYEETTENKQEVLLMIKNYVVKMRSFPYVYARDFVTNEKYRYGDPGSNSWAVGLIDSVREAYIVELKQILELHDEAYIKEMVDELSAITKPQVSNGGCYVATCVYGSYDCPQVWTLRRYRDYQLAKTWYGRVFIHTYYAISPTIVKWFGSTAWFKKMWKSKLDNMVKNLQDEGVQSTPYEDQEW